MSESIINSPVVHSAALTLPSLPVYCCFSTGSHHTLLQRLASNPPGGQQTRSDCRPSVCHSVQPYRKLLVGGQEIVCLVLLAEPLGCSKKKKSYILTLGLFLLYSDVLTRVFFVVCWKQRNLDVIVWDELTVMWLHISQTKVEIVSCFSDQTVNLVLFFWVTFSKSALDIWIKMIICKCVVVVHSVATGQKTIDLVSMECTIEKKHRKYNWCEIFIFKTNSLFQLCSK